VMEHGVEGANKRKQVQGENKTQPKSVRGEDGFFHTSTFAFFVQMCELCLYKNYK
jgi:hypothetical protein